MGYIRGYITLHLLTSGIMNLRILEVRSLIASLGILDQRDVLSWRKLVRARSYPSSEINNLIHSHKKSFFLCLCLILACVIDSNHNNYKLRIIDIQFFLLLTVSIAFLIKSFDKGRRPRGKHDGVIRHFSKREKVNRMDKLCFTR